MSNRNKGKLIRLLEMPMDVLYQIACHLNPLDLLHLAHSSRAFRDFFLSKSTQSVWRASMDAVKIPHGPGDINEPQLVDLLFVRSCQACNVPNVKKVYFDLRIRLCMDCMAANVLLGTKIARKHFGLQVRKDPVIYTLLPSADKRYLEPDFCDVLKEYLSLPPDSREREAFVESRRELTKDIYQHASKLRKWLIRWEDMKQDSCFDRRMQRQTEIVERLRAIGDFSDREFQYCRSHFSGEWDAMVFQDRPLSDAAWKKYKPKLLSLLDQARKALAE